MEQSLSLPAPTTGAEVFVVAAEPGDCRTALLRQWLDSSSTPETQSWILNCDSHRRGLWAGLDTWLLALLPRIEAEAPDLVSGHDYELLKALPVLQKRYSLQHPNLTESAPPDEAVRNYALDRAFRIGQGIVDLLAAWHRRSGGGKWLIVCDNFESCGKLVQRFFYQLLRRRAGEIGFTLVVAVDPEQCESVRDNLGVAVPSRLVRVALPTGFSAERSPAQNAERALELEKWVGKNQLETEIHLPEIIDCWLRSNEPQRALHWQAMAFGLYNHYGFYEDSYYFCEVVLANLDVLTRENKSFTRWNLVGSIFGCLVAIGQAERAFRIVKEEGLDKIDEPVDEARVSYVLAMLHARFLPRHDFDQAEQYIVRGLQALESERVPEHTRRFLGVFLRNGLAFVRHRQGKPLEAIELCETGFEELDEHLPKDSHRLHRSVLLYNIAQVYAALGSHDKAIESFSGALEMDPNYSEYHNERGCSYLQLGRFDEAIADFHRAIEVSPPYAEVWTNLGQCFRRMGRSHDAEDAFSKALDLEPEFRLALVGRADARVRLEKWDLALEDASALLVLDSKQPLVLANRASILGKLGQFERALLDLDSALTLSPREPILFYNRAFARAELGLKEAALEDLRVLRELSPAVDVSAIEGRLGIRV